MKTLLLIGLFFICMIGLGQINVGVQNDSIKIVPMNILSIGTPFDYDKVEIDLDNNDSIDIELRYFIVGGGDGRRIDTYFNSYDKTQIISDTVQTHYINDGQGGGWYWDTIVMPCPIKLDSNQIIHITDYSTTVSYLAKIMQYYPWGSTSFNVHHWVDGQPHYVGFIKEINEKLYLGWIKIKLDHATQVYFYEWAIQIHNVGITEQKIPLKIISTTYYDILGRKIPKPKSGLYIERNLTNKGVLSRKIFKQL